MEIGLGIHGEPGAKKAVVSKTSQIVAEKGYGGMMVVQVDSIFSLEEVLNAHAKMRNNENIGKIVMSVSNAATTLDWFAKQLNEIKF